MYFSRYYRRSSSLSDKYRMDIEFLFLLLNIVVLCIITVFSIITAIDSNIKLGSSIFLVSVVTLFAWLGLGGFFGFLFGIPKLLQHNQVTPPPTPGDDTKKANTQSARFLNSNSNLEEISDWITKIIVGVSLIQLNSLPDYINRYGSLFRDIDPTAKFMSTYFILLTIYALCTGFLLVYIETRTRITSILQSAESDLNNGPSPQILALVGSANQFQDDRIAGTSRVRVKGKIGAPPTPGDAEILEAPISSLTTAEGLAARASAHARAGELVAAESVWKKVFTDFPVERTTNYYLRLAEVQTALDKFNSALGTLREARRSFGESLPVLRRITLLGLYASPPEGFQSSIEAGEAALKLAGAENDPMLHVWLAAAYGQRASWEDDQEGDREQIQGLLGRVRELARRIVELVPNRDETPRRLMQQMLNPRTEGGSLEDDDLKIFHEDEELQAIVMS